MHVIWVHNALLLHAARTASSTVAILRQGALTTLQVLHCCLPRHLVSFELYNMRWNARPWSALQISSARATYIFHVVRWQTVQNQRQKRMQSAMDWPQALSFMQPLVDCPSLMKCSVSAGRIARKLQALAPQLQCRCALLRCFYAV